MLDGVIDGYDGLSQAVSLSIYRLLRYAGERALGVFFFLRRGPAPTQDAAAKRAEVKRGA